MYIQIRGFIHEGGESLRSCLKGRERQRVWGWVLEKSRRSGRPETLGWAGFFGRGLVLTDLGGQSLTPHRINGANLGLERSEVQGRELVVSSRWKMRIPMKWELFKAWFKLPLLQMCIWYSNFEVMRDNLLYMIVKLKRKKKKKTSWRIGFLKNWVTYCETLIQTHVLYIVFNHNAVKWPLVVSSSYCVVSKRVFDREGFLCLLWCYSARNMFVPVEKKTIEAK